ncbi:hypothetical protein SNEBB_009577 [Seison nebaliae]|nr:hypothetical protein SNEBB_009577 [Seison nebaliae]
MSRSSTKVAVAVPFLVALVNIVFIHSLVINKVEIEKGCIPKFYENGETKWEESGEKITKKNYTLSQCLNECCGSEDTCQTIKWNGKKNRCTFINCISDGSCSAKNGKENLVKHVDEINEGKNYLIVIRSVEKVMAFDRTSFIHHSTNVDRLKKLLEVKESECNGTCSKRPNEQCEPFHDGKKSLNMCICKKYYLPDLLTFEEEFLPTNSPLSNLLQLENVEELKRFRKQFQSDHICQYQPQTMICSILQENAIDSPENDAINNNNVKNKNNVKYDTNCHYDFHRCIFANDMTKTGYCGCQMGLTYMRTPSKNESYCIEDENLLKFFSIESNQIFMVSSEQERHMAKNDTKLISFTIFHHLYKRNLDVDEMNLRHFTLSILNQTSNIKINITNLLHLKISTPNKEGEEKFQLKWHSPTNNIILETGVTLLIYNRSKVLPLPIIQLSTKELFAPAKLVLDASGSKCDFGITAYKWKFLKLTDVPNLKDHENMVKQIKSKDFSSKFIEIDQMIQGSYIFELSVTNKIGYTNSSRVQFEVFKEKDLKPVAVITGPMIVQLPKETVFLYGNSSTDDKAIVRYDWKLNSKDDSHSIDIEGSHTSILKLKNLQPGKFSVNLTVTDGADQIDTQTYELRIVSPRENPHWWKKTRPVIYPNSNLTVIWHSLDHSMMNKTQIFYQTIEVENSNDISIQTNTTIPVYRNFNGLSVSVDAEKLSAPSLIEITSSVEWKQLYGSIAVIDRPTSFITNISSLYVGEYEFEIIFSIDSLSNVDHKSYIDSLSIDEDSNKIDSSSELSSPIILSSKLHLSLIKAKNYAPEVEVRCYTSLRLLKESKQTKMKLEKLTKINNTDDTVLFLDGELTSDESLTSKEYYWENVHDSSVFPIIQNQNDSLAYVNLKMIPSGSYRFRLTVTDSDDLSASDECLVEIDKMVEMKNELELLLWSKSEERDLMTYGELLALVRRLKKLLDQTKSDNEKKYYRFQIKDIIYRQLLKLDMLGRKRVLAPSQLGLFKSQNWAWPWYSYNSPIPYNDNSLQMSGSVALHYHYGKLNETQRKIDHHDEIDILLNETMVVDRRIKGDLHDLSPEDDQHSLKLNSLTQRRGVCSLHGCLIQVRLIVWERLKSSKSVRRKWRQMKSDIVEQRLIDTFRTMDYNEMNFFMNRTNDKTRKSLLLFDIRSSTCSNQCSNHGYCEPLTHVCICGTYWMSSWLRRNILYEENCDWSIFYVALSSFFFILFSFLLFFIFVSRCCLRRLQRCLRRLLIRSNMKKERYQFDKMKRKNGHYHDNDNNEGLLLRIIKNRNSYNVNNSNNNCEGNRNNLFDPATDMETDPGDIHHSFLNKKEKKRKRHSNAKGKFMDQVDTSNNRLSKIGRSFSLNRNEEIQLLSSSNDFEEDKQHLINEEDDTRELLGMNNSVRNSNNRIGPNTTPLSRTFNEVKNNLRTKLFTPIKNGKII